MTGSHDEREELLHAVSVSAIAVFLRYLWSLKWETRQAVALRWPSLSR